MLFYNKDNVKLYKGKCEEILTTLSGIDIVVTSPPYNIGKDYNTYTDDLSYIEYLAWIDVWVGHLYNILNENGSFFLNIGSKPSMPYTAFDALSVCRKHFVLQNTFHWIKSIYLDGVIGDDDKEVIVGHFKPINSTRYVNDLHEFIFHFTKNGDIPIDRLSIGSPYKHPSNLTRWNNKKNIRCRGNTWFIPYKTVTSKKIHPAQFPSQLASNCIKLAGYNNDTVVLDPFIGVGNTCVAATELGCKSIGIDIDDVYLNHTIQNINIVLNKLSASDIFNN